jgi:hypothetical protein
MCLSTTTWRLCQHREMTSVIVLDLSAVTSGDSDNWWRLGNRTRSPDRSAGANVGRTLPRRRPHLPEPPRPKECALPWPPRRRSRRRCPGDGNGDKAWWPRSAWSPSLPNRCRHKAERPQVGRDFSVLRRFGDLDGPSVVAEERHVGDQRARTLIEAGHGKREPTTLARPDDHDPSGIDVGPVDRRGQSLIRA